MNKKSIKMYKKLIKTIDLHGFSLLDAKQIPFVGYFTTSSKLNAGELKLLFLSL